MAGLLDERGQEVEELGRQRDRLSVAKQLPFVDVEAIRPEREQARRCHPSNFRNSSGPGQDFPAGPAAIR